MQNLINTMNSHKPRMVLLTVIFLLHTWHAHANDSTLNEKRLAAVVGVQTIGTAASLYALNEIWYKDYPRSSFHLKDDMGVWLQVDKVGHAYSAYSLAGPLSDMYVWTGMNNKASAVYGTLCSYVFLSTIEFLDAHSEGWGFSYGDVLANTIGAGLFLGQELVWEEQRVQLKYSFHKVNYEPYYRDNMNRLFGTSFLEQLFKDYNGQTYWLSSSIHAFGVGWWPKWLNIAVGYGGEQMYGAYYNSWKDEQGKYYDANHIPRLRQWYIAPDIDLSVINTKSELLNVLFDRLTIKIPTPALEFRSDGFVKLHPVYF